MVLFSCSCRFHMQMLKRKEKTRGGEGQRHCARWRFAFATVVCGAEIMNVREGGKGG